MFDEQLQKKWHKLLTDRGCKLYSLRTPPLCRRMRLKWFLYLISGLLKLSIGLGLLAVTLIAAIHLGDDAVMDALGHETAHKVAIYCSAFANFTILVIAAFTDLAVFFSAPRQWPRVDNNVQDIPVITSRAYGNIVPEFFESRFAERHRLQTQANRVIITVSTTLCIICAIPKSSWRLEGCSIVYSLKDYIMTLPTAVS